MTSNRKPSLTRATAVVLMLGLGAESAQAASSSGGGALALAALVGRHDPFLTFRDKRALAALLDGSVRFAFPRKAAVRVVAAAVTCRASDVDITAHSCSLTFRTRTRTLRGRVAHELGATLIENGVSQDGAAGSIFVAVTHLTCTIRPAVVKQRGGGGAQCTWSVT